MLCLSTNYKGLTLSYKKTLVWFLISLTKQAMLQPAMLPLVKLMTKLRAFTDEINN